MFQEKKNRIFLKRSKWIVDKTLEMAYFSNNHNNNNNIKPKKKKNNAANRNQLWFNRRPKEKVGFEQH